MPAHLASLNESPPTAVVVGAAALAWIGFFVHNFADLPGQSLRSPETGYPGTTLTRGAPLRPADGKSPDLRRPTEGRLK